MLVIQCVASLEAQRIVQSDSRPGHSSPQRVRRRQLGSPPGSPGRVEDLQNRRVRRKRLAGRSSFDRNRQSVDEIHSLESSDDLPLWSRSQAKYAVAFAKWAETSGVHVITTHPHSVRHGGASSDALWRTRSFMEILKRGRWRSEKSVQRYETHARLLKETAKLSTATRKYGQLVISRIPAIARRCTTPSPASVWHKLVRSRA